MLEHHSLYAAAKVLAGILGVPWTELQATYRALQGETRAKICWLPKSAGRNVYYAHPSYIDRLLVAHVSSTNANSARDTVEWMVQLSLNGKKHDLAEKPAANIPSPIEKVFHRYLVDAKEAAKLETVEIHPDAHRIIFNVGRSYTWLPEPDANDLPLAPVITKRPVISGDVFRALAEKISWGFDAFGGPTLKKVQQGAVGDDE